MLRPSGCTVPSWKISLISSYLRRMLEPRHKCIPRTWTSVILWPAELKCCATENQGVLLRTLRKCSPIRLLRLLTEEGLYTRNVCLNRQFWHAVLDNYFLNYPRNILLSSVTHHQRHFSLFISFGLVNISSCLWLKLVTEVPVGIWIRDKFNLKIDRSVKMPWQEYGVAASS